MFPQHRAVWEVQEAHGDVVLQIIRPTGLLDPQIEVKSRSMDRSMIV